MNAPVSFLLAAVPLFSVGACSERGHSDTALSDLVASFGYEVIETDSSKAYLSLEKADRASYQPISSESGRIRSLEPLDGYHGPTRGNYFLTVERYSTEEAATTRAEEYRDLSRLAAATDYDQNELSKMTVRCWGYSSGKKAYLLTTHAAMHLALEARTQSVMDGIVAYLTPQR